jgi:hypothetical protein
MRFFIDAPSRPVIIWESREKAATFFAAQNRCYPPIPLFLFSNLYEMAGIMSTYVSAFLQSSLPCPLGSSAR